MAITPSGSPVAAAAQAAKQRWNCPASSKGQNIAEVIVGWGAVDEGAETAGADPASSPQEGDGGDRLGPRKHRKQTEKQDLVQRIGDLALLSGIVEIIEMVQENDCLIKRCLYRVCASMMVPSQRIGGNVSSQHSSRLSPTLIGRPLPLTAQWEHTARHDTGVSRSAHRPDLPARPAALVRPGPRAAAADAAARASPARRSTPRHAASGAIAPRCRCRSTTRSPWARAARR